MKKIALILSLVFGLKLFSQTTVTFTTPGTTNWTVPTCITTITVQLWGGGGGGGSSWARCSNSSGNEACAGAGGGGGGGYTTSVINVTAGQTFAITVGNGGNGGSVTTTLNSGTDGTAGGTSSIVGGTVNISATGGNGGVKAQANNTQCAGCGNTRVAGAGGTGGSGNGTISYTGGTGSAGAPGSSFDFSGAGGGGAGSSANGSNGNLSVAGNAPVGGAGGASGGGKGGDGRKRWTNGGDNGLAGVTIGAGGGGGLTHRTDWVSNAHIATGGAGARGEVRILHSGATPPVLAISPPVCNTNSTSVNLSATASSTNSPTYAWTTTGGIINSGSTGLTPNVKGPGTFTLTAYNGVTTCSSSAVLNITTVSCNLLPVELTEFNAQRVNEHVDLNWQTASEINNDYFVVERSLDGVYFQSIGVVKGKGNTYQRVNYHIIDKEPGIDITYYRLKQVDLDGKYTYSKIASVEASEKDMYINQPVPNPFNEEFSISFQLKHKVEFITEIIDLTGKKVRTDYDIFEPGTSYKFFHLKDYENGIYFLNIKSIDGSSNFNYKLIKN